MLVQTDDTELFCVIEGGGRPMLVMHGGLGLDHTYLRPWLDALANQAQIVYYDHRGNGRSARSASLIEISHDIWTADADALREQLGFERVILFGHSYGGYLAQEYALRYGKHLDGLVLCCTAPAVDYPDVMVGNLQSRSTPEQFKAVIDALSRPVSDDATLKRVWYGALPLYFKNYDAGLGAEILEKIQFSAAAFNHSFFKCQPNFNTVGRLNEVSTPALVIAGRDDWAAPPAQGAERLHAELPNSEMVIFEDSGHFPFIEENERFVSTVGQWIRDLK